MCCSMEESAILSLMYAFVKALLRWRLKMKDAFHKKQKETTGDEQRKDGDVVRVEELALEEDEIDEVRSSLT